MIEDLLLCTQASGLPLWRTAWINTVGANQIVDRCRALLSETLQKVRTPDENPIRSFAKSLLESTMYRTQEDSTLNVTNSWVKVPHYLA